MLNVDMSTLRLAPGANGTLQSLDLFGAKVIGDIAGLGTFSFGSSNTGATLVHVGNGIFSTVTQANNGTYAPRDYQMMAWNAIQLATAPLDTNDQFINQTSFGIPTPSEGLNAKLLNGDSNGPAILKSSINYSGDGRVQSLTLVGIDVGQNGGTSSIGGNLYIDSSEPTATAFQNSFLVPEPSSALLLLSGAAFCLRCRLRRTNQRNA